MRISQGCSVFSKLLLPFLSILTVNEAELGLNDRLLGGLGGELKFNCARVKGTSIFKEIWGATNRTDNGSWYSCCDKREGN